MDQNLIFFANNFVTEYDKNIRGGHSKLVTKRAILSVMSTFFKYEARAS